jgi:NADH-quinone oxidoreductase subunit I
MTAAERKPGEEHLYREEKYASVYEINMLRCIFCGLCEEACPKDAIYLSDSIAMSNYTRKDFIYGKDRLVEPFPRPDKHINKFEEDRRLNWLDGRPR